MGLTISLDAMGGDHAPQIVVEGARLALQRHADLAFLLCGDETAVAPLLKAHPGIAASCRVRHTVERIAMEDKPSQVLRRGQSSSMGLAIQAVASGEAAAAVSAGNTGGLMALAMYSLSTMPGIDRPAIGALWPTRRGSCVFLDMGANVEASAKQLAQFAVLGTAFAHVILRKPRPRLALLNVGAEELKGRDSVREAAAMLKNTSIAYEFIGFVEGSDIPLDVAEVIVSDGFSGNVAIKTAEGTVHLISHFMKEAFGGSLLGKLGALIARGAFKRLEARMDPNAQNGGVFLGLNGIVVKSHGSANGRGFASAIDMAVNLARSNFAAEIAASVKALNEGTASTVTAASGGQPHRSAGAHEEIAAR